MNHPDFFYILANQNCSFSIFCPIQSADKNLTRIQTRWKDGQTDGQTDRRTRSVLVKGRLAEQRALRARGFLFSVFKWYKSTLRVDAVQCY